jgi:hypothetical protein
MLEAGSVQFQSIIAKNAGFPMTSNQTGFQMTDRPYVQTTSPGSRQLADLFAILLGMSLLGMALYGGPLIATGETEEIRYGGFVWLVMFVTGTIALVATGFAQWERYQRSARIVLAVNGLALLAGLVAFNNFGLRALLMVALPGIGFLVLSRFLGPLPPPRETVAERR